MHRAKKHTKVVAKVISSFFGSKTPHKGMMKLKNYF
jgi:hypothetical protein